MMMVKDKALRYNAHIGFPPSQSALCATLCQVFVLQDQLREERGMERKERKCVCVRGGGREWEGSLSDRHLPAVCVMQRWLGLLCVSVCARDCTWLSGVCEWTAA